MQGAQQWYMAIGGHQVGPVSQDEILANLRNGSIDNDTLVFTSGMAELAAAEGRAGVRRRSSTPPARRGGAAAAVGARAAAPTTSTSPSTAPRCSSSRSSSIPGEAAVAEAGSMMYMTDGVQLETIFGDGSRSQSAGVLDALLGAGKRILTGESLFMTVFTNNAASKQRVAFAAPYAGKILPMDLRAIGGQLICQKDSFLCAARGVSIGIAFQRKIGVGIFGGEGFIMQKLEGDGLCFVHAGGTVHCAGARRR